jgi:hydroxyacylglutathione hydrolase
MAKAWAYMPRNRSSTAVDKVHGKNLVLKRFEETNLARYSYIAISQWEAIDVHPESRSIQLNILNYAKQHNAKIVGVLNTTSTCRFCKLSDLQVHQETQATIYVSDEVWAEYPHILAK